jgi:hypothetical protein
MARMRGRNQDLEYAENINSHGYHRNFVTAKPQVRDTLVLVTNVMIKRQQLLTMLSLHKQSS